MATHAAAKANALRRAEASLHIEVEHLLTREDNTWSDYMVINGYGQQGINDKVTGMMESIIQIN